MRTVGDWVLAALGLMTLLVLALVLWWFGPWHATVAFGIWSILSAPLLIIGYRRTGSRWLLYLGSGLIPSGLSIALLGGDAYPWDVGSFFALHPVAAALPFPIRIAWTRRLLSRSDDPQDRWVLTAITSVVSAVVFVGTISWARAEAERPAENRAHVSLFAGCYEVELGPWIPSVMLGHAAQGIVPARIRLDTTRGDGYSWEATKPLIRPGWQDGDAYWVPTDSKRVELVWHNGFNGVRLSLHRRGSELRGRAVGHTDVGGFWPESRALVRARPIACSEVPVDSVRANRTRERAQRRGE